MSKENSSSSKRQSTRRQFLKGVPMGIVGAFAITEISRRLLSNTVRKRNGPPEFPEDSIFAPAKDRYS